MRKIVLAMALIMPLVLPPSFANAATDYAEAERLIAEGELDKAQAILSRGISEDDKNVAAFALLGEVYLKKGDRNKALKYLNKAISVNPEYPVSYLYLGKLYYSNQKFDEAVSEFDRYMERMRPLAGTDTNRAIYIKDLHDISQIYFGLKRYEEIRKALDEILGLSPQDQTAIYNMGIYNYVYEHNRSRAYKYFSDAVAIDPASYTAKKAKYAIEFMRANPDSRIVPEFSFIDQEYRD